MTLDEAKQAFENTGASIISIGPETSPLSSVNPSWLVQFGEYGVYVLDQAAIELFDAHAISILGLAAKAAIDRAEYNAKLEASETCPGCGVQFMPDSGEILTVKPEEA